MRDDAAAAAQAVPVPLALRVRHGIRHPQNWLQLIRFALVGASGYVVNLATFALCVEALGFHYPVAATVAFLVAVTNNFWWNRHWTFRARDGHAGFQAARFLVVSALAFGLNLLLLHLFVADAGLPEVPAQALAILAATPLSFLGNKLWSFRI